MHAARFRSAPAALSAMTFALASVSFAPDALALEGSVGLEGQVGAFGLFNLEGAFTKAAPTLGLNPSIELRAHPSVALGAEWMLVWARPETSRETRFLMSPQARARLMFSLHPRVNVDVVIAAGLTVWPRNAEDTALSPRVANTRVGWSGRAGLGLSVLFNERWSLHFDVGYFVTSAAGDGVWLTHDTALATIGPRVHFL